MKNLVLASIEDESARQCLDFFSRPDGTFGFEIFRSYWEHGGLWVSLNRYSRLVFSTEAEARRQAAVSVPWAG